MALSVHPLDVGDLQLDSSFWVWQSDPGTPLWAPTTAWLILGAEKPILVDTSFRSVDDAARYQGLTARRSPEQELRTQLERHGLEPGDIGYVLHTHLHMDHAGQDYLLPDATLLVRRQELQNAAAPNMYPAAFYDRLNIARLVDELWDRLEILDEDGEVFDGLHAKLMPGHTPAHQMVRVRTDSGTVIVAGDAAMNVAHNVKEQAAPGFFDSMADTMTGLRYLERERKAGVKILLTHDTEVFELYPDGIA